MKVEIDVDVNVPEGWRLVRYGLPKEGEYYLDQGLPVKAHFNFTGQKLFIIEKIKPRRRVFECVSEEPRLPKKGDLYENDDGHLSSAYYDFTSDKYTIWKEVTDECEES